MRVIKVGGRAQRDPRLCTMLADAWRRASGELFVVHGGGNEVSALQQRLGVEPAFVGGRRLTSREDVELVRMALSGAANKRLVTALIDVGAPAVGVSGEDGALLLATRGDPALGYVGTPIGANPQLLRVLMGAGYLPVLSPLARAAAGGGALNVNADDAAALLAAAVGADELLLVSDVPAVLRGSVPCSSLDEQEARALIASGDAAGGMMPKLEAALTALAGGVSVVRIGGLEAIAERSAGTAILAVAGTPVSA